MQIYKEIKKTVKSKKNWTQSLDAAIALVFYIILGRGIQQNDDL